MNIGSLAAIGLDGMRKSLEGASNAAHDIASMSSGVNLGENDDSTVNLAESITDLKANQHVFDASAKVVKTADEVLGTLLNLNA